MLTFSRDIVITRPLDLCAGDPARRALDVFRRHVREGRLRHVVDLSQETAADWSVLRLLITILRTVREAGGHVRLAGARPHIVALLTQAALHRVFDLHESVAEAVTAYHLTERLAG